VYEHQSLAVSDFGYGWLSKVMYEEADGFIAVSQGLQREINKEFPNKPCALAYNPVEANEIVNAPATNPIFVTASRLELVKGVDVLVRLFAEYKKAGGAGELRVYGDGSLENELRLFINQEKLSSSIKLMGVIDSLPKELADVTAYLSCARKESLGVSLLESIAAGVPIVCTDVEYGGREVMGIRYDEKLTYPFLSKVGVLISDEPTKEEFMTALNVIIREGAVMRVQAKERSRFFTVDKAVSEINIFLRLF
jgi:glycosyltransferase involved in cell wall biosynthesis